MAPPPALQGDQELAREGYPLIEGSGRGNYSANPCIRDEEVMTPVMLSSPSRKSEGHLSESTKLIDWDFPGGTVVKNQPAKAEDTGWSSGPGRSHMPRSN